MAELRNMWIGTLTNGVRDLFLGMLLTVIRGGKSARETSDMQVDLGSILGALPDAVLLFNCKAKLTNLNDVAESLLSLARSEVLGLELEDILERCLENIDQGTSLIQLALQGRPGRTGRLVFQNSGELRHVLLSASPIRDPAGTISGALLVIQDVTELSTLRSLSDTNERQAVGQITAGMVHDVNNILSTIGEAVCVLRSSEQRTDHDLKVLNIIGNAVRYAGEIIKSTREHLIGNRSKPKIMDVRKLLNEVLELTGPLFVTHPHIDLVSQIRDCGSVAVVPDDLRRAFTNLILNALDAMPQGGTLTVDCTRLGPQAVVAIRDTGVGISREMHSKIFRPYFTTKTSGTGLGLAGARRAIEAQGGSIRFESNLGVGTTFFVSLPLAMERGFDASAA